ncbi:MAG: hypothetical protein KGY80_02740 [Candidatus Thorarchaeota archaeon]|nr:hypothetical protein [Candidatus Thorarchaeota archaeon]
MSSFGGYLTIPRRMIGVSTALVVFLVSVQFFAVGAITGEIIGDDSPIHSVPSLSSTTVINPIYETTWKYSAQNVFPDIPGEFANATLQFRDLVTDDDGFVYVLCNAWSSYEYYEAEGIYFNYQFLVKYDSRLKIIWAVHNENGTYGNAMTINDGYIYTTGSISTRNKETSTKVIVTKWASNGERIWQAEWAEYYFNRGVVIAVGPDDTVYVSTEYRQLRCLDGLRKSRFLKFNSSGFLLWNKTTEVQFSIKSKLETRPDGIYSWTGIVEKRDFSCSLIWNISRRSTAMSVDESGNVYLIETTSQSSDFLNKFQAILSKWDADGNRVWASNFSRELEDGCFWRFDCRSLNIAPDGNLIAIFRGLDPENSYHIFKFDSGGELSLGQNYRR